MTLSEMLIRRKADGHGLPCYLESSHDINIIIYGKLGFELRKQIFLTRAPGKELRLDVMVREPITREKREGPAPSKAK